jgi:hypothetical protein
MFYIVDCDLVGPYNSIVKTEFIMKNLILLTVLIASVKCFGAGPILTNSESKILLGHIDSVCGDTWCEGDFDFHFKALSCFDDGSCDLTLDFIYYDWSETELFADTPEKIIKVQVNCTLTGFAGRDDIIYEDEESKTITYSDMLYDRITTCIDDNEDAVYEEISKHYN